MLFILPSRNPASHGLAVNDVGIKSIDSLGCPNSFVLNSPTQLPFESKN